MPAVVAAAGNGGYRANAVSFDGTNDWLSGFTANFSGSKEVVFSIFVFLNATTGTIFHNATAQTGLRIYVDTGVVYVDAYQSGSSSFGLRANFGTLTTGTWYHILFAADMTSTSRRFAYINDVAQSPTWITYVNANLQLETALATFGALSGGSTKLNAYVSDFWLNYTYMDISTEANRRKFVTAGGRPVYLGLTGQLPTGTASKILLSRATTDWYDNRAGGGIFTVNGSLSTAPVSPST
jgi:hypothetical protein